MHPALRHLPNAITLLRAVLIPVIAFTLAQRDYDSALLLFVVCALGDFVDGWLARAFDVRTRFGAIADPLADKLTMLTVTLLLAWQGWLPWWFALLVATRDVVIVTGALAYHFRVGHVEMAPTWLSKFNTVLEFSFLTGVLALAAGVLDEGVWWRVLLWTTTTTILLSGVQYVVLWGRKAARQRTTMRPVS
ncbi:MAG: CDP-alcohol phosphatidyltransferase family protein [Burkholderiaceae bacterium]|nr:CDP-alcohol phosphatidyltransferase family protein [Burkholderiaceae bacterium]